MKKTHGSFQHLPPNRTSDSGGTSHFKAPEAKIWLPSDLTSVCAPSSAGAAFESVCMCMLLSLSILYAILSVFSCECVCVPILCVSSVKQEQRECQNSRGRIWGSNNRDWQRQTEIQHHKHMRTNQKDGDVVKHQTACCTTLISQRLQQASEVSPLLASPLHLSPLPPLFFIFQASTSVFSLLMMHLSQSCYAPVSTACQRDWQVSV